MQLGIDFIIKRVKIWLGMRVAQTITLNVSPEGKIKASRTVHYKDESDLDESNQSK